MLTLFSVTTLTFVVIQRDGIDKVVVGRATINKVVIRNEAFVRLNESNVGGVLMTSIEGSCASGLR